MIRAGFPGDALDIVGAVGHGNNHRVAIEGNRLPQIVRGRGHDLAVTFKRRRIVRCHAAVVQDDSPVPGLAVLRFEVEGILESDEERSVRDDVDTVICVCTRGETGNGKRDRAEEAQGHEHAHYPAAADKPSCGEGGCGPSVLHNGSP